MSTCNFNRVSYNGGRGGITARPGAHDQMAARERHIPATAEQTQHLQAARSNPELRASANHGRPPVAATPRPGAFSDRAAVPAKHAGGAFNSAANRSAANRSAGRSAPANSRENAPASHAAKITPRPSNAGHFDFLTDSLLTFVQGGSDRGPVSVSPGGLDHQPPQMSITSLGDGPALHPFSAGGFARHRAAVAH